MSGTATTFNYQTYPCDTFYNYHPVNRHFNVSRETPFKIYDVTDNRTKDFFSKSHFITMNDAFHREDERLKTYENWPLSWLDKKVLAQTGMFYTGDGDKVKCYFCEVEIGRWELDDQPVSEHLRWSSNCPLLRRRTTNNVPIDNEELNQILPPISYDICGANDAIEMRNNSDGSVGTSSTVTGTATGTATANATSTATRQLNGTSTGNNLANATNYRPEFSEYKIESARLRSFSGWPEHMKQTPAQMAEAGFFHSGLGDRVKCFSCGGGLKDWDDSDDPWEQHALWLPKCRFLKLVKGESFIEAVTAKHKQANAELLTNIGEDKEKPSCSVQTVMTALTPATTTPSEITTATSTTISPAMMTAASIETSTATTTETSAGNAENCNAATPPLLCDKLNACNQNLQRCSGSNNTSNICSSTSTNTVTTSIPEEKLCKICYVNEYNTAFLPCGHVVACAKCASSVTNCPMCRKDFTDVMRVYFS